jgi:hypothetical protein
MKKVRRVHFWIGVIASIFLFIESLSGIIMYFGGDNGGGHMGARAFQMQGRTNPNWQASANGSGNSTNSNVSQNNQGGSSNSQGGFSGNRQRGFQNGQFRRGNFGPQGGASSFSQAIRQLHSGIIGLIAGIGMLLLTGTGLVMAIILGRAKRKQQKRDSDTKIS